MNPAYTTRHADIGLNLFVREWVGEKRPFLLLHGLTSNSRTWTQVGDHLAAAGHRVLAVDQRGHGRSDKPESGYDFATVTADLARLIAVEGFERPYVVGQSWGGNVVLAFGAAYPSLASGLGFVDGGFLDLHSRFSGGWEQVAQELKPPNLLGTPRSALKERMQAWRPDWSDEGIEGTLDNFETLPDGTVRPWLSLDRHMEILRALWQQRPWQLYPQVQAPVLIAVAEDGATRSEAKAQQVAAAKAGLAQVQVHWLFNTAHDIHVHRPAQLAGLFLDAIATGFWPV